MTDSEFDVTNQASVFVSLYDSQPLRFLMFLLKPYLFFSQNFITLLLNLKDMLFFLLCIL